jgi:hypothetical protein
MTNIAKLIYQIAKLIILGLIIYPITAIALIFSKKKELTIKYNIFIIIVSIGLLLLWGTYATDSFGFMPNRYFWPMYDWVLRYLEAVIVVFACLLIWRFFYKAYLKLDTQHQIWAQNIRQPEQEETRIKRQQQIQQKTTED